ncbi:NADP oxidoreductase [Rathayibacter sp. VKM Ac-2803]|uniref:NADPH-dependent F420 reductase n=1 Tax=unclassified Rathayibacter TaxID=2609250 RepID=UPI0013594A1D|nr:MULTISPECIES: NAD(P)-binding domain-containing protein [unclassified Rathayibacter]MWV48686.1 NADP oxidoreductase [Rathayibacter sp. VKM Ac-2803]MWV60816.1 NADP oxidoreductase [Rathayibacter sp. VKM Ac-2754]
MNRIGIIGSGSIGAAVARLALAADYEVVIANSRGPESLGDLVEELGPRARAGDVRAAVEFGAVPVLAVPLAAYPALPADVLAGRTILSTGNYYPHRDGRIEQLDSLESTTAEYEQSLLPGTVVVKAFTNILFTHIPNLAHSDPRTALAISGNDSDAKARVSTIVDALGFDPYDAGTLAESWRTEPESGAYTQIYVADLELFTRDYLADPGAPLTADRLAALIAASHRADVRARQF